MKNPILQAALQSAVKRGVFAGAVLLVSRRGTVLFHEAAGYASLAPRKVRMTRSTVFDLASLTKPVATTTSVMRLVDRGVLSIDEPVRRRVPEFAGEGKEAVTIRNLLNHSSGLRAWEPFYKEGGGSPAARRRILARVFSNPLVYPTGTKSIYSDLGFILLGEIVERAGGMPLDRFSRVEIFSSLKMTRT
ncbi:MAG TPA: serine hydrolase domain-containing protein, partial [Nitrospiria bacterium]